MQQVLLFGDAHLEQQVDTHNSYLLFKKVVQSVKPSQVIIGGDLLDFSYISKFSEGLPGAVEGKRLKEDFSIFEQEIKFFKKYSKDVFFIEGNHENRILKFLDKNPVLKGMLSLEQICEENNVVYIPTANQPYKYRDDLYICHGLSYGKYFTYKHIEQCGNNIAIFHTHRTQEYSVSFPDGSVLSAYGFGCLCSPNPDYVAGKRITGHTNSFGQLVIDDSGLWQMNTILIKNGQCILNNKVYSLY